ncbi:hypothetical protein ACFYUL_28625 [Streptomyces sp. NPDC004311]|uniref:hypothetical protein n=1 Tax=Streptomyces sp. NPDC004311 TaxID=3364698 RepID=UPI0036889794
MRDPHATPLAAAPGCPPEQGPLPCCPVCEGSAQRISWRQRAGRPVLLAFEPCGHTWSAAAPPTLTVTVSHAGSARPHRA